MKKSLFSCIMMLVALLSAAAGDNNHQLGDVNCDSNVDINDLTSLIDHLLGQDSGTFSNINADTDRDGNIGISDVTLLIDYLLGAADLDMTETFTANGVEFKMVKVEGGIFTMGATADQLDECYENELPAHEVTLGNYRIGQTEVTQALWVAVMGSNPSAFTDDPQCPVESVSWDDCQAFITKLNQMTGKRFRLPTEAEWEYAARGGRFSKGYTYAGGNDLFAVGFHWGNSGPYGNPFGTPKSTHPVAQKAPNELELYDMSGNVNEWCQDWFGYYSSDAQTNPTGPVSGQNRVYRGGSWNDQENACTVTWRKNNTPQSNTMGLRLAL